MSDWIAEHFGLFGAAYGTALFMALLLPWLGVVLVLRQRLFTAAAVAQSAALGFAVGMALGVGHVHEGHGGCGIELLALGACGGVLAGMFAMQKARASSGGLESWAAVLFLFGGSASMLLLADAPHGLQEVQRLQLSSLLGASETDLLFAFGLLCATLAMGAWRGRRMLLVASDEAMAQVLGLRVHVYRAVCGIWIGVCLSFAIHVTGLLFAFSCTVLPVLVARQWARSLRMTLLLAPIVSVVTVAIALWIAQREEFDWPPGQAAVALQAVLAAVAMARRSR